MRYTRTAIDTTPLLSPAEFNRRTLAALYYVPPRRRLRWKPLLLLLALGLITELVLRWIVGLGDPPLYQSEPSMEYMLQPSKTYLRFGNRIFVNRYGMRSADFPPQKSSSRELRILVVGDSVIYGGVRIGQREIDTEILRRNLQRQYRKPVVVGNISAKSWGPPNELAYLKRFGTFDADVVILVLSSHDYADAPSFVPVVGVVGEYPEKRPWSAMGDLLTTYILPSYFHWGATPPEVDHTQGATAGSERDIAVCREAEIALYRMVRSRGAKVVLVQHLSQTELTAGFMPGYFANQSVAVSENVPHLDDATVLRGQLNAGKAPFYPGDPLHLDRPGQEALAQTLQSAVAVALRAN
jgi:hypothetical protein